MVADDLPCKMLAFRVREAPRRTIFRELTTATPQAPQAPQIPQAPSPRA